MQPGVIGYECKTFEEETFIENLRRKLFKGNTQNCTNLYA